MILQALHDLYGRLESDPSYGIAPPGFSPQKISFRIVLKPDGTLFAIEDARSPDEKGKPSAKQLEVPIQEKRTSGVKAQFMCDKLEYVLGYQPKGKKEGTGTKCFNAFKEKHILHEHEIRTPSYTTLCMFLKKWDPSQLSNYQIGKELESGFGVFQIQGEKQDIHNNETIKAWWRSQYSSPNLDAATDQCLITGKVAPTCRIHPDIKGFKSSIALVGIQENTSYESYARSKTENCPISEDAAFRYATALNTMLAGPRKSKHRLNIGTTTAIFWTDKPSPIEDFFSEFIGAGLSKDEVQDESQRKQVELILQAVRSGSGINERTDLDTAYYILGLEQPNPGRFSIRFFHCSNIQELLQNLNKHHQQSKIVRSFENEPEFPAIWQLLDQIAPPKGKKIDRDKIPPLISGALARAIIEGTPYPEGFYSSVIRRIHADRTVNYLRASILKAILTRNHKTNIPIMLDTNQKQPAYLLGRLFAALEQSQRQAHEWKLERTIRETFFGAASATPASVFPRIHKLHMHHLRKLSIGSQKFYEDLIGEILGKIGTDNNGRTEYPNSLTLKEQGVFAIGYYHQSVSLKSPKKPIEA